MIPENEYNNGKWKQNHYLPKNHMNDIQHKVDQIY